MTRTIHLFALLLMLCLAGACGEESYPEFRKMENVQFKAATLKGEVVLTADAVFFNPNPIGAQISHLDLDIYVDDNLVANTTQDIHVKMKPNSEFKLPIEAEIPITRIFEDVKGGFLGNILKNQKVHVKVEGDISASLSKVSIDIPIRHEGDYEVKVGI